MDLHHYQLEDFILDDSFQNYCLQSNEQDVAFWEEWVSAHPHRKAEVEKARRLYLALAGGHSPAQIKQDKEAFARRLRSHVAAGEPDEDGEVAFVVSKKKQANTKYIQLLAAAAAAAVLLFVVLRKQPEPVRPPVTTDLSLTKQSRLAERKSFQLPDGSTVMLNAGSSLNILPGFNSTSRQVELEGEAFFEVAHNAAKPFIIHTRLMKVKVLGTRFNVKAYPNERTAEAALIRGSVEVELNTAEGKKLRLKPDEKIVVVNPATPKANENTAAGEMPAKPLQFRVRKLEIDEGDSTRLDIAWTQNRLAFEDKTLGEITLQLERWYGMPFVFENEELKAIRYTGIGIFEQKTLKQVLDYLQLTDHRFTYEIRNNNQVVIRK